MKKNNIVVYWLIMIALFVSVLISQQLVASIMQGSLSTSKFGDEAMFEIIWAGLVLIIILVFKNKYIFTQQRENFFSSLQYILPELILSGFFILISIISISLNDNPLDIYAVFNLALYCLFIGIVEEFLCRGWLLNEFLERYSKTRREIILSILFSSLIFGVVHFINIGETQGFFETLVQVMNAAAGGIFLALVYYKTKNIWVVVASHAIWDFSLFLSQANTLGDCLAGSPNSVTVIASLIQGMIFITAYGIFCYWLFRQTDLYTKEKVSNNDYLIGIGIAIYVIGLIFVNAPTDNVVCPEYEKEHISSSYQLKYYYDDSFDLEYTNLILEPDPETGKLWFRNNYTGDYVYLTSNKNFKDYILIDNGSEYTIIYQTKYNIIYYGSFSKEDIEENPDYLEVVKNSMVKRVVPDIDDLGVLEIEDDSYQYPMLKSHTGEILYFDSEGKLYLN